MAMNDPGRQRWKEIDRLFAAALERPQEERERFVAGRCGTDAQLCAAVISLLRAERDSEGLFRAPDLTTAREALQELATGSEIPGAEPPLERVGAYRLLRRIGRGGMGSVYLAERAAADFQQRVALKLLRRGIDTEDIVRRFLLERRILAGLAHPNIARLYDGGSTEDGRPYLVMEYVDGTPITEYCDAARLPLARRLELFLGVADAVRYAHAQLVVHRDLKPSNILVTRDGRVKLLDFGIARILDAAEDDEAPLTRTGSRVLTPEYASPEQLSGRPITTASDVYQLGILLYLLLAGHRPFDRGRAAVAEGLGGQEVTAVRASARVGSGEEDVRIAHRRSTTPERLRRALRGDLDTVLQKALREQPERRYTSVEQLADDIRRHLDGRPVGARPDTLAYRATRFLRRNRLVALAGVAALLFLLLYVGSAIRHATRLERERNAAREQADRAEQVQRLLIEILRSPDPFAPANPERGRAITVVEALDTGASRVLAELGGRPRIQANLLDALVEVYTNLGTSEKAVPLAARALSLHERDDGVVSRAYRDGLARLALALGAAHERASADSALALLQRRLTLVLAAPDPSVAEQVEAHNDLASQFGYVDRIADAERELRRALTLADSTVPPAQLAAVHRGLSDVLQRLGHAADAVPHARQALTLDSVAFGVQSANAGMAHESLAEVLSDLGRNDEAAGEYERGVAILERTLGPENGNTLNALNNLAVLRRRMGDLEGAERDLRRLLEARVRLMGPNHREVGTVYQNLGTVLSGLGRLDEAAEMHRRAASIYEAALQPGSYLIAFPHLSLAGVELAQGDFPAGEASARRALRILERALPAGHFATAVARCRLGRALLGQGRAREGMAALTTAARVIRSSPQAAAYRDECLGALEEATAADAG